MKLLIAGGGTGGHIMPGLALAEELTTRQTTNDVLFVGAESGLEKELVPREGFRIELLETVGIKGKGLVGLARGLLRLPAALWRAVQIVREYQPDAAIGVGGYASGPAIVAARLLGVPTAIQEQNVYPGLTNRLLAWLVDDIFTSFDAAALHFPRSVRRKCQFLGNPIRRSFLDNFIRGGKRAPDAPFTILVIGGSQGAHAVNLAALDAVERLLEDGQPLHVIHQSGQADLELVRERYTALEAPVEVHAFIRDMASTYRRADLVISRAGAMSLAELTVSRKAAVLVPFPHAANDHQTMNALSLVSQDAALMMPQRELSGARLADLIRDLRARPERLRELERAAGALGRPEAAREIIDVCFDRHHARTRKRRPAAAPGGSK